MKIAVITPVSHLPSVVKLLSSKGKLYMLEEGSKQEVRELLINKKINTILCNPNKQTFKLDKEVLKNTDVKLINTCSTGMNHIDQKYCKEVGIKIYSLTNDRNLIKYLPSTSELALGLMMCLLRKIPESIEHTKNYGWDYTKFLGRQVKGLKIGVVGYGRLGKMFTKFVKALGAEVYIYDPYKTNSNINSLKGLFKICDVISLHVHVTKETKYFINRDLFGISNNNPYIINTSRGEIVNELDIVDGLRTGLISGYGADVVEDEFGTLFNSPIIKAMNEGLNILVTPHTGGMTIEGQTKAYTWAINKF